MKVPLIPTLVVAVAVAIMIALGFWQLDRRVEKEDMIARYSLALQEDGDVPFPRTQAEVPDRLYRYSTVTCAQVLSTRSTASRNRQGTAGLAQVAECRLEGGGQAEIFLGFSSRPQPVDWPGGEVSGWIAPAGDDARLVADPPQFGLSNLPIPDPTLLPNNHLAYAGQWFFFALTALVIYVMVLRKR